MAQMIIVPAANKNAPGLPERFAVLLANEENHDVLCRVWDVPKLVTGNDDRIAQEINLLQKGSVNWKKYHSVFRLEVHAKRRRFLRISIYGVTPFLDFGDPNRKLPDWG